MNQIKDYTIFGRQVGYVVVSNIIIVVLGLIQTPILTKILGPSFYGLWALIFDTILLIIPFSMLSFNISIVRFLAAEKDKNKIREDFFSAYSLVLISGVILSLLLFLCSSFIATYIFQDSDAATYVRASSILVLLNSLLPVLLTFFKRGSNIGIYTALSIGFNVLNFGLTIFFVLSGYGLTGVILATIISFIVFIILSMIVIFKQIGFQHPRFLNMKSYLKWGIPLIPNTAIQWIILASDRYFIVYFLGASAVGIYNVAHLVGEYTAFALMPLGVVLFPIISKKYDEGNLEECRIYLRYSFRYIMMVAIPAAFGLSILAKPLLQIFTTSEFVSGSPIVALAAFGALFHCLEQICSYILQLVGKTQIILRLLSGAAILNIILNIVLIPPLGIVGAAIGSIISYCVLGLLTVLITRRYLKFDLSLVFIIKSLISSTIMSLCIWLLKPESILMVAVSIVAGIAIYFLILTTIKSFSKTELVFFISFLRKRTTGYK